MVEEEIVEIISRHLGEDAKRIIENQNEKIEKLKNDTDYYKKSRDELISSNRKLREEKLRLNNIIDEIDMMLKTLIMESEFSEHKLTAKIILMNLNELRGFNKGDNIK